MNVERDSVAVNMCSVLVSVLILTLNCRVNVLKRRAANRDLFSTSRYCIVAMDGII